MNHKKLIRQIQLSELSNTPLSYNTFKIYEFLNRNLSELTYSKIYESSAVDFYNYNYDFMFRYDKNGVIWFDYKKVWEIFITNFKMQYSDIKGLLIWYIEGIYPIKINEVMKIEF